MDLICAIAPKRPRRHVEMVGLSAFCIEDTMPSDDPNVNGNGHLAACSRVLNDFVGLVEARGAWPVGAQ